MYFREDILDTNILDAHLILPTDTLLFVTRVTILQVLYMQEIFDESVKRSGWTVEAYQKWLAGVLKIELLGGKDRKRSATNKYRT